MNILYEDNHIIVAFKESGILSQEDISKSDDMLTILKDYIKVKYNKPGAVFLGLVHRLDRNTSGVMVFARTSKAASRLSQSIINHDFKKSYLAVVDGKMDVSDEYVLLVDYLRKDEALNKSFVTEEKSGKEAVLEYRVIASKDNTSLLDIRLHTGRHHQIRCQLANMGHPIYGDAKYDSKNKLNNSYLLSAYKLSFPHPTLKEEMSFSYFDEKLFYNYKKEIKDSVK